MPAWPRSRSLTPKPGPVMECTEGTKQVEVDPENMCKQRPLSFDSTVRKDQNEQGVFCPIFSASEGRWYVKT